MTPLGTDAQLSTKVFVRDGGEALSSLGVVDGVQGIRGSVDVVVEWPDVTTRFETKL